MDSGVQQRIVAGLPPSARYGLEPVDGTAIVPARELAEPDRLARILRAHAAGYPGSPPPVVMTLWWYLASAVLIGPPAAGALLGIPLSASLHDLELHLGPIGMPAAAVSHRPGPANPGAELGNTLATLIDTTCSLGGVRPRPLWAIAIDSLANRLLTFGRAIDQVSYASALAIDLAAATEAPLPPPRFLDIPAANPDTGGGRRTARFLIRTSCCLLYRTPSGETCTTCPRQPAPQRLRRLTRAAADLPVPAGAVYADSDRSLAAGDE